MSAKMFWGLGPGGQFCGTAPKGGAVGVGPKVEMGRDVEVGVLVTGILSGEQLLTITKSTIRRTLRAVTRYLEHKTCSWQKLGNAETNRVLSFSLIGCELVSTTSLSLVQSSCSMLFMNSSFRGGFLVVRGCILPGRLQPIVKPGHP